MNVCSGDINNSNNWEGDLWQEWASSEFQIGPPIPQLAYHSLYIVCMLDRGWGGEWLKYHCASVLLLEPK